MLDNLLAKQQKVTEVHVTALVSHKSFHLKNYDIFISFYIHKKKVLDSRKFSIDLDVLRCPEHDLTLFRKYLSVCLYYFGDTVSQELMCGN